MFVQVNYQDMFTKIRTEAFNNSSIESLELERDKSSSEEKISF